MSVGITHLILGSGGADLEFPSPTKDSHFGAKEVWSFDVEPKDSGT